MARYCKDYQSRWEVPRRLRRALRMLAHGTSYAETTRVTGVSSATLADLTTTKGGRDYLAHHRDQVDAHRVLLAATLPYLDLSRAVATGRKPSKRDPGAVEREGEG